MRPNPRVAFYAPMKAPGHPTPSGDRQIARLTMRALEQAGFTAEVVSELRTLDRDGDVDVQSHLTMLASLEAQRLADTLSADPPVLWFTYHCHYKAPDLVGPAVAQDLRIPYVISEPSISPKRKEGPWAAFAEASERAIGAADLLFWTTERDRPALEAVGHGPRMHHLPAFLDPGPPPPSNAAGQSLRLLTVAMMRPGDKVESYRRLSAALEHLEGDWTLDVIGDGEARDEVEALFAGVSGQTRFLGAFDEPAVIRARMEVADLFLWPGVGEGVGMVWLEAQAAGLPVIAEDHPAARAIVENRLAPATDAPAFAGLIRETAADLPARAVAARAHIDAHHSLKTAAETLGSVLRGVIG